MPSEPSRLLSPLLARLQSLRELEEAATLHLRRSRQLVRTSSSSSGGGDRNGGALYGGGLSPSSSSSMIRKDEAEALLSSWRARSKPLVDDFELVEPVSSKHRLFFLEAPSWTGALCSFLPFTGLDLKGSAITSSLSSIRSQGGVSQACTCSFHRCEILRQFDGGCQCHGSSRRVIISSWGSFCRGFNRRSMRLQA